MVNPAAYKPAIIYRTLLALMLGALLPCALVNAEIYSWIDEHGNTIYSDQKPSAQAKPTKPSASVNYYTAKPVNNKQQAQPRPSSPLSILSAEQEAEADAGAGETDEPALTEEQCQRQYRRSCDEVINWLQYARQACGDDPRCDDEDFLDRKYRPRTNEELVAIANRAAVRNKMIDKEIEQFLTKKYSNYCQNHAAAVCQKKRGKNCVKQVISYCKDPRSLKDIFQRYDNLSLFEKRQIIDKAKKMSLANGDEKLDIEKILGNLLEILVTQAVMGI